MMQKKERLFHALIFELLALSVVVPVSVYATGKDTHEMIFITIGLSIYSVIWNYVYNFIFDKICKQKRELRSVRMRLIHASGFECGFIFISIPIIAWALSISIIAAFFLELVFILLFFLYTAAYNYAYDKYQPYKKIVSYLKK